MNAALHQIGHILSGIYAKSSINADTLYLQATDFNERGEFNAMAKPQVQRKSSITRHLLQDGDVLFAAKGRNNFAVVYSEKLGSAVASSSLVIVRIKDQFKSQILPTYLAWYLSYSPAVKQFPKLGTTVPSITIKQLSTLEIDIPGTERQEKILHLHDLRKQERQLINKIQILKDEFIQRTLLQATK